MPVCTVYNTYGNVLKSFDTSDFGRTLTIGRGEECDICLQGVVDATVSHEQLLMRKSGNTWTLEQTGRAAIYKDGLRQEENTPIDIKDGDIFRFSSYFLCIGAKTGPSKYELTWTFETDNRQKRGVLWPGVNIIGASKDNEVTIRTEELSRHHGKITVKGSQVLYEKDHDSCRVSINGRAIGGKQVEITPADEIILGTDCPIRLSENTRKAMTKIQGAVAGGGNREIAKSKGNPVALIIILLMAVLLFLLLIIVIFKMLL